MDFLPDTITDGVRERRFTLGDVPGVLFSPPDDVQPAPPVLLAHGGGLHTVHPVVVSQARRCVGAYGLTVAALDAPGHGDRPRSARLEEAVAEVRAAMAAGSPSGAVAAVNAEVAVAAVPEWRAVLDALMAHGHVRPPVGFVGFSMGAAIGVPLLAAEPRIAAAVIGLIGHRGLAAGAARITVPVQLVVQRDDEIVAREDALALFAAIGSSRKSLHASPGGQAGVPAAQRQSSERFLAHHHRPGTRAYLSSGLPGADWWLAGPVTGTAEEADVELDEVERFCTEHGLWDQST